MIYLFSEWARNKILYEAFGVIRDVPSALQVFGLSQMPDQNQLRTLYRQWAFKHHPDRGGDPEQFKRAHSAYEIINNAIQRGEKPANQNWGGEEHAQKWRGTARQPDSELQAKKAKRFKAAIERAVYHINTEIMANAAKFISFDADEAILRIEGLGDVTIMVGMFPGLDVEPEKDSYSIYVNRRNINKNPYNIDEVEHYLVRATFDAIVSQRQLVPGRSIQDSQLDYMVHYRIIKYFLKLDDGRSGRREWIADKLSEYIAQFKEELSQNRMLYPFTWEELSEKGERPVGVEDIKQVIVILQQTINGLMPHQQPNASVSPEKKLMDLASQLQSQYPREKFVDDLSRLIKNNPNRVANWASVIHTPADLMNKFNDWKARGIVGADLR